MAPTSLSNTYKVFHNLHMLWMYIRMSPYHGTASLTEQALWKFGSGGYRPRGKQQCTTCVLVEAVDPSTMASTLLSNIYTVKMAPISLSNTWKEFHNLHMLWMCIWMSPFCSTASLAEQAFGSCLELWVNLLSLTGKQ